jgi:hypothetical protein
MKMRTAAMALYGCLATASAGAQGLGQQSSPATRMPPAPSPSASAADRAATPAPDGPPVFPATSNLPGPTPDDELKSASIALPDDPLEPYLLTKANGPFMVMAKVFRGPDAEKMALVLCKELREEFKLPAYILRSKEFPMKSYIRGTPVQAPSMTMKAAI